MKPSAFIFDFGNVIAHFDFKKATRRLGERLGVSGQELLDQLGPLGFVELLQQYESGRISANQFSTRIGEMIRSSITHDEFVAAWSDIFTPNLAIVPILGGLKDRGYPLILGSNTNDMHAAYFRVQFAETLRLFDRLVLSYEVGHTKPSREFYMACTTAAEVAPGACVFVDDLPANVEGARNAGLWGILYQSTDQLSADLANLGVLLDPTDGSDTRIVDRFH